MAAKKRSPSRRVPDIKRADRELVGLELTVRYRTRPPDSFALVRDVAEMVLCFTDDTRARDAYREHLPLDDDQPLPGLPLDSMLARAADARLSEFAAARESGQMRWLTIWRTAGRGKLTRKSLRLEWRSSSESPELCLWLTLNDLPVASRGKVYEFAEAFFTRACKTGEPNGRGDFRSVWKGSWHRGGMGEHEAPSLMAEATRYLVACGGGTAFDQVRGVHHFNLFSRAQLRRLGGRPALIRALARRAAHEPDVAPLSWKELDHGSLLVVCARVEPEWFTREWGIDSHFVVEGEATAGWLLARVLAAGLMIGQDAGTLAGVEAHEARQRKAWARRIAEEAADAAGGGDTERDRERKIAEFMEMLWKTPPSFIASVAQPLKASARQGVRRRRGGHGQGMTAFRIDREGKAAAHTVWGRAGRHGDLQPPYAIGGPTARTALCVFDPSQHGFDARNGLGGPRSRGALDAYHCTRCGHNKFHTEFLFEYGDPEDLDDPAMKQCPQDYFSWFTMRITCAGCGRKSEVGNVECA